MRIWKSLWLTDPMLWMSSEALPIGGETEGHEELEVVEAAIDHDIRLTHT